nr:MerR family DNA-binding transcriptional regulator [Sphaerisporangium siamense]
MLLLSEKSGLLTPVEIATVYGVDRKTSTRLGKAGRLAWGRTSDGQRRDRPDDARVLLGGIPQLGDD